ncbi:LysR family transcriptional regulator [Pseudoflavonifractor phocaeensis]|uniref:LysR family transcriptional regulator n=1 Tax=Pseudoflavonifractor phocaeensis TaxID=1870988 RepID=UPI00210A7162|nr:LysR family transcriptional regulator [Pseudoflavonifractor phocaeensis]
MRLEQLEFLIAVADSRSITRAAANLFITQPTLSGSMNNLEKELGFAIFRRSQKGVSLTPAGEEVYREAKEILSTVRGWERFSCSQEPLAGTLTIAYTAATSGFLNRIIEGTTHLYPDLHLFFYEFMARSIFQELEEGKCQLGISGIIPAREETYRRDAAKFGWTLDFLCEDAFHIMVSTQNPLSRKDMLDKADLEDLPLAMLPKPYETVSQAYFKPFFPREYPCYLTDRNSIMQLVAENKAAAVFPALSMQNSYFLKEGLVRPMLLRDFTLPIRFYLLSPARAGLSRTEEAIVDMIREMDFLT